MAIPIAATLTFTSKAFQTSIKAAGKGLGVFAGIVKSASIALTVLTGAFTALVFRQAAVIDRIGKVAKTTGIAAETLQRFGFAAELAGVSTDQAQVALRRFSRRLGEAQKGTGELAPTLKRLGINLKDSSGEFKSAEDVLFDLADAIADTENSSERLSIAFKAFDSEGAELVNVLREGGDAMRALFDEADSLGAVLSGSAIQGVEQFNDEFNKLQTLISGISNQFVAALAPALTEVTEDLVEFLKQTAAANGGFENLGTFLKNEFIDIVQSVVTVFGTLVNMLISVSNAVVRMGRALPGDLFPFTEEEQKKVDAFEDAMDRVMNKVSMTGPILSNPAAQIQFLENAIPVLKELGIEIEGIQEAVDAYNNQNFASKMFGGFFAGQEGVDLVNKFQEVSNAFGEARAQLTEPFKPFDIDGLIEYLEKLKEVPEEVGKTNKKVEEQLTFFEKIAALLAGMPGRMQEFIDSTVDFADVLEKVAARLTTPMDRLEKTLQDGLVKGVELFEQSLTDAILTGKADFSALGDHIKKVLAQALVQRFITGPILAAFGLASGGPAKAGQPYIVGEEGPELFVPNQSGTVVPNHALGNMSGGPGIGGATYITNISAVDTQSFQTAIARDPEFIFNVSRAGARRTPQGGI